MNKLVELVKKASSRFGFLDSNEERQLIEKAQKGDKNAMDHLFCSNSRYLLKEAVKYSKFYNFDIEDIFNSCVEGFVKAVSKFDFTKSNRLITLCGWWVKSCVQDEVYRNHTVHIPHNKIALLKNLTSENLDTPEKTALFNAIGKPVSLDKPVDSDEETSTLGSMIQGDTVNPEDEALKIYARREIETIMDSELSYKEATVLKMAFGFEDGESKTLAEIGERIGCTKQRADQIKKEALKKLRSPRVAVRLRDFAA